MVSDVPLMKGISHCTNRSRIPVSSVSLSRSVNVSST